MAKSNIARHMKTDGSIVDVLPKDGKKFSMEELQAFVGGTFDIMRLPEIPDVMMILNDNGMLDQLPYNQKASEVFRRGWPSEKYPHNNPGMVVGDVLIASRKFV